MSTVVLSKVYAAKARENYVALVGEVAPKKLDDVVAGLEKYFAGLGKELSQCDVCGGYSTEEVTEACPYCDDGKEVTAAAPPPMPEPSEPVLAAEVVTETPPQKLVKVVRTKLAPPPVASAPMILAGGGGSRSATEADLDAALEEYNAIAKDTADAIYRLGVIIRRMREQLWQQRTDENGKPKYKSFEQFVESELGISRTQANRHRRIVEVFTRDQIMENPPGVLKALIAAPKEAHEDLLQMHKEGSTVAAIEKRVKEIREEKGIKVIETEATKAAAEQGRNIPSPEATAKGANARKKDAAVVTVGLKAETGIAKMFAKPKKKGEDERRARTLEDQPFGKIEAINGVAIYIAVKQTPAGELEFRWTAKREDPE